MVSVEASRLGFLSAVLLCSAVWISTYPTWHSPVQISPKPYRDFEKYQSVRNYTQKLVNREFPDMKHKSKTFGKISVLDKSVRMCGCSHCFKVLVFIDSYSNLQTKITSLSNSAGSKSSFNITNISYFDILIEGQNGVFARLVTDSDDVFHELSKGTPLYSGGLYSISLTLQYLTTDSAFGFDNPQPPQLNCTLRTSNNESQLHFFVKLEKVHQQLHASKKEGWRYAPSEFSDKINVTNVLDTGAGAVYFKQSVGYKQYFVCPSCSATKILYQCAQNKRVCLLGDSHIRLIWMSLKQQIPNINASTFSWNFLQHGTGIYRNRATISKETFEKYVNGSIPASFFPGPMLKSLRQGDYKELQEKYRFDTWVISSGHWDLRDDTVENYITHLEELLPVWSQFQKRFSVRVVWNGVPSFSYKAKTFGGLEKRTNVKIAVADARTKLLVAKYNITYVPFFDISYPFYSYSCDTHHYLCPNQNSPIGSAQLNTLLNVIC